MRTRTILAVGILAAFVGAAAIAAPRASAEAEALSAREQRWLDRRISDSERAVLDSIVGYAPPEIPADFDWYQGEPVTLAALRGKVVVLQSWTRTSVIGRAAPVRAAKVLDGFSPDDVRILAIHTPEGADGAEMYLDRREVGVPVILDKDGAYCDELGAFERPVTLVLDRQGAVRYAGVSITGLPQSVAKLVAEPFDAGAPAPQTVPSRDDRDRELGFAGGDQPRSRKGSGQFPPFSAPVKNALDIRGKKGPNILVQHWFTDPPNTEGKVVVAEFWATWCGACRKGIPHLNELQAEFKDEVVVIGLSDEPVEKIQAKLRSLNMKYAVGTDPAQRTRHPIRITGIPHAIIMSPDGIVRWQGNPLFLEKETLRQIVEASDLGGGSGRLRWSTTES